MPAYNLFRRKGRLSLCCAVPEDAPVPSFVPETRWEFWGKVEYDQGAPGGFDPDAARVSTRFNGFYVFQRV